MARKAALALGIAGLASVSMAQTVPDGEVPATGLDLPSNLQIFGNSDPNVRKATAIVNDAVITGTDVDQRMALIAAVNNLQLGNQEIERMRLSILRALVDETLQIQEARANEIEVTRAEIDESFVRVARNFNRSPEQMRTWLKEIKASEQTLRRQIEAELAWSRLLRRNVSVEVSETEVQSILDRLKAAEGTPEYHIFEIYSNASPERAEEVFANQQRMIEQLRQGTPFESIAGAMSEATTKARGGDVGWIRSSMLPDALARAVEQMQVGQVAGPVEVPGGFSTIYLVDKRQVLTADPRDAKLSLKQLTIRFAPGTTEAQATGRAAEFASATQRMQGCGDAERAASELGAEVVDNDAMRVRDLPAALQTMILELQIGEATRPFGSVDDGVRVLVLCGRDDPQTANLPTVEQVQDQIAEQRVNLRAQRMLRDLRRDALVEYR